MSTLSPYSLPVVTYEHPLVERMRMFLRLESLLELLVDLRQRGSGALESSLWTRELLELSELLARGDVRTELLKELERLEISLRRWDGHRETHGAKLTATLEELGVRRRSLFAVEGRFIDHLRASELLSVLRQRMAVPGGLNGGEIPAYRLWLSLEDGERGRDLDRWLSILTPLRDALATYMRLMRTSALPAPCQAIGGTYERDLSGQEATIQLIRLNVPLEKRLYPEISAGRYRLTVRFRLFSDAETRGTAVDSDIDFHLALVTL